MYDLVDKILEVASKSGRSMIVLIPGITGAVHCLWLLVGCFFCWWMLIYFLSG